MKSLLELYGEHQGKVSDKWSIYLAEYDRLFSGFREQPVRMLEIGIQNGGSLEIWSKYFPNAQILVGCDINPDCAKLAYDDPRIKLVIGDANTDAVENEILSHSTNFDLVIDDGSHTSSDIAKSFTRYFSRLNEGGLFVAEDLHCSYWREFEGGLYYPYSSMAFFKRLADVVNHEHWGIAKERRQLLLGFSEKFSIEFDEHELAAIHSIEFFNSACVVRKLQAGSNVLGERFIAGRHEFVVPGLHRLSGTSPTPSQASNVWAAMIPAPEEAFASLTQAVADRDGQIANLNEAFAARERRSSDQLASMVSRLAQETAERAAAIASLNQAIAKHDGQIAGLNQAVAERDGQIASLNQAVAERDGQIVGLAHEAAALRNSTSWRLTKPLRFIGHQLARGKHLVRIAPSAFRMGGGPRETLKKAIGLYRREGFSGLKRGIRIVQTGGEIKPAVGSDAFDRNDYAEWVRRYDTIDDAKRQKLRARCDELASKPKISVVMPTYNPKPEWLIEAIESVRNQIYPNWELCIADDASNNEAGRSILSRYAREDSRIKVVFRESNGHISEASNSAMKLASGAWVALLDHDDLLSADALFWVAHTINKDPGALLIYSDEDKIDDLSNRSLPFFKPDWSPHLMLSQAYLGHLVCYEKKLIDSTGGFVTELNGAQDYGLALECASHLEPRQIQHIPRILYHWRMHAESTAKTGQAKPYAHEAGRKALNEYVRKHYPGFGVRSVDGDHLFTYKSEFQLLHDLKVSIIIPTKDGLEYLEPCIDSILNVSTWKNIEIIILDNGSVDVETLQYLSRLSGKHQNIKVVSAPIPFNWSKLNNIGAKHATGQVLVFMNNDTKVISPSWIESMAGYARLPDVGTVGALLLFEDGSIQHSGVVVGMGGWADHIFRTAAAQHTGGGPFASPVLTRNVLAVTGACVAIARDRFDQLGGFDESFVICGSDVELGLRAHKHGFFNVMCAEAKLFHYESKTRSARVDDEDFVQSDKKYAPYRQDKIDPFYNPNLSLESTMPAIRRPFYDL